MKFYYGSKEKNIDVTQICYSKLLKNCIIEIPYSNKLRKKIFSKSNDYKEHTIFIKVETNKMLEYNENYIIQINSLDNKIRTIHISFSIYYGTSNNMTDITEICLTKLKENNIIKIPNNEIKRRQLFNLNVNNFKKIFIKMNNKTFEFNNNYIVNINLITKNIHTICTTDKLNKLHSSLKIKHGNFKQELPEQEMIVKYLSGYNNVLEIGSNIGRASLIISSILKETNNYNLVTLETDKEIAQQLLENKQLNNLYFHIENSALSKRKLIQKGWDTIASDILLEGYKEVNIITWEELNKKYNIQFDTLVLDCEGAFYYILMDMPEILDNIKLIIMENDYHNITKKEYIDEVLLKNNFYMSYSEGGGWGPCKNYFYEVWKK
jgi:FkbM family methyltransferase